MKSWLTLIALVLLTLLFNACFRDRDRYGPTPNPFVVPAGFPEPQAWVRNIVFTQEGFLLGRKLFYEGQLSADGSVPCGSCHEPYAAFTTFAHDRSHGYNNSHTLRNAPGLFNLAWYPAYHQDGSAADLHSVYLRHINRFDEMGANINEVVRRIQRDPQYRPLFRGAFGNDEVTAEKIFRALDQFVLQLVSANSKFDWVQRGEAAFTAQEGSGYALFQAKCASCHAGPLFTDFSYRNTGHAVDPLLNDFGRMRVTGNRADSLKFRVPSLRNLDFTSYYQHDGRFSTPFHVFRHYRTGIQPGPTLDPALVNGIQLTPTEEQALAAFLSTLSDSTFLSNPAFRQ